MLCESNRVMRDIIGEERLQFISTLIMIPGFPPESFEITFLWSGKLK